MDCVQKLECQTWTQIHHGFQVVEAHGTISTRIMNYNIGLSYCFESLSPYTIILYAGSSHGKRVVTHEGIQMGENHP